MWIEVIIIILVSTFIYTVEVLNLKKVLDVKKIKKRKK